MNSEVEVMAKYNKILKDIKKQLGNKTTYSSDLNSLGIRLLGGKFNGVYPADKIKISKKQPYCIVNTDTSKGMGEHWCALAMMDNKIIFYDSFARDGVKLIPQLKNIGLRIINTDDDIEQKILQSDCGQRSLSWLIFLDKYGAEEAMLI